MDHVADLVSFVAQAKPAGGAALDQVFIATAMAGTATAAMLFLITRHRNTGNSALTRAAAWTERMSGLPSWAALPSAVAGASLIVAVVGMYWDISLHIADGRDPGPLANPAHYLILVGLFGVFSSGCLSVTLPRGDEEVGPAPVNVAGLRAPIGGVLMATAGSFALLGFPLDDVWHRLFGQDVTLWGPTHLMLIGGAGMCLVGQAVLLAEGMYSRKRGAAPTGASKILLLGVGGDSTVTFLRRVGLTGGLLIGLSTFQGEFDFGVPQFALVLHPILIAFAAGCGLTAARLWIGRGGALGAAVFFLIVRGLVGLLVGPVLGEPFPSMPLYLVEAAGVEVAALLVLQRRGPMAFGALGGLLAGTVGFAAEYAWTQIAFPIHWTSELLPQGLLFAAGAGVAGGLIGGLFGAGLNRDLPPRALSRAVFAAGLLVIGGLMLNGLVVHDPQGVKAQVSLQKAGPGLVNATVRFDPPSAADHAQWAQTIAWQGGGLREGDLKRVGPGVFKSTEPLPVTGEWKSLVRVHRGRELGGVPVYLPADPAIPAKGVPARPRFDRQMVNEKTILQRELKKDVPTWLWAAASLVVLVISMAFIVALGWGTSRLARGASEPSEPREERAPRRLAGASA